MIELPPSVRDYLTNEDIHAAVNALATGKQVAPADLRWNEAEAWYAAQGAALYTNAMFAVTLTRLWEDAWADALAGLPVAQSSAPDGHDAPPTLDQCWTEEGFSRCFALNGGGRLWADAWLDREDVMIGARVSTHARGVLLEKLADFRPATSRNWIYYSAGSPARIAECMPRLRDAARRVVAIATR